MYLFATYPLCKEFNTHGCIYTDSSTLVVSLNTVGMTIGADLTPMTSIRLTGVARTTGNCSHHVVRIHGIYMVYTYMYVCVHPYTHCVHTHMKCPLQ